MNNVNMHLHSHFSFNAENWAPTKIAEECSAAGLDAAGLIDFDVLDGLDEFFAAGERLGLRSIVGLETRVFYNEFADKEIDSPGEPGVHYMDGIGFCKVPDIGKTQHLLCRGRRAAAAHHAGRRRVACRRSRKSICND